MNGLTASRLLVVWEQGAGLLPVQRALALLAMAFPGESPGDLADLSIGQRDHRLLKLREQLFGSRLASLVDCPACGERVETQFQVSDIILHSGAVPEAGGLVADLEGYHLRFRLPNSQDLLAAIDSLADRPDRPISGDRAEGRRILAERCVLETLHNGDSVRMAELPQAVLEALGEQIAEADPLAEIWISLTCPSCGHTWQVLFDVLSYLWGEIDVWAYRTLHEVHSLARAYGWSEAEILGLSAWRRQYYLSLL